MRYCDGGVGGRLYALGPPARRTLGEITAIAEIHELCGEVAAAIDGMLARRSAAAASNFLPSPLLRTPRFR